ncbi:MAG: thioredoxin family protein [Candidatus Melainabacteria bacterium]|nr:thioredoxin family protein [Candidatus Melainabacteria bacterium]
MREMIIAFIIALVIGSVMNEMNLGGAANHQTQGAGQELISELDSGTFQGIVLDSKQPVLVDFYTTWCGPCKEMEPIMGTLALNGQEKIKVARVDCDKNKVLAEKYEVTAYPTFILFQGGQVKDRTTGGRGLDEMRAWLKMNQIEVPATGSQSAAPQPTAAPVINELTPSDAQGELKKPSPEG